MFNKRKISVKVSNPIADLLPVEERSDGVYIKVERDQRDHVDVEQIRKNLAAANVTNCNMAQIEGVVSRARGGFEKIAPPFEYYNPLIEKYVEVTLHPLEASVRMDASIQKESIDLTFSGLLYSLRRKGIKCGIDEKAIASFVKNPVYGKEVVVARGSGPQPGADGKIEMIIRIDPDARPRSSQGNKVNYRDIQSFAAVAEGDVIARRIPPQPGKMGMTVTGSPIDAPSGKDVTLPRGKNTFVNDENTQLLAGKTGIVYRDGALINIKELLSIKGNVDFSSGNIKYSGNVFIAGDVKPGFSVETEGDIHIEGEVESARIISRSGAVKIDKGVIGKNDTYIYAKEGIHVGFAQDAELKTEGLLTVQKYVLHCECSCDIFKAEHRNAGIVGGITRAYKRVEVGDLGNTSSVATRVSIVNKVKIVGEKKIAELLDLREKISEQIVAVARELKGKSAIMRRAGAAATGKHREELKKVVDRYNNYSRKVKYIEKKIEEIRSIIEKPSTYDGYIAVREKAYPGTELDLYEMGHKLIHQTVTNKIFKLHEGAIQAEGNNGV